MLLGGAKHTWREPLTSDPGHQILPEVCWSGWNAGFVGASEPNGKPHLNHQTTKPQTNWREAEFGDGYASQGFCLSGPKWVVSMLSS